MNRLPMSTRRLLSLLLALALWLPGVAMAASPGQPAADRGVELFRAGDFQGARDSFREAVRLDPRHVKAWENLGWAELKLGDKEEALRIWNDLLRIDPDRPETLQAIDRVTTGRPRRSRVPPEIAAASARADDAVRKQQWAAAEAAYRELLSLGREDSLLRVRLAWVIRKGGRPDDAIAMLREITANRVAPVAARVELADALASSGKLAEAREAYDRALLLAPKNDPKVQVQLAQIAFTLRDPLAAERIFAALLTTPRLDPTWAPRVAEVFIENDALDRGRAFFASSKVPDTVPGKRAALARFPAHLARQEYQAGRYERAVALYAEALSYDERNRAALRDMGWAYRNIGRRDEAEKTWRRYAATYPELAEPHAALSLLYLDGRQYDPALRAARASLAVDPQSVPTRLREVRALLGLSRVSEALRNAEALAKQYPDDAQVQRLLADALSRGRQHRAALLQWRRVLDLDPTSGVARQNWIRALLDAGEPDRAMKEAAVYAEDPNCRPGIVEMLAEDATARKDFADAVRWYGTLTHRFPDRVGYWRNRMSALQRSNRPAERVAVAREALRRMPERYELQFELVTALMDAGQLAEALERAGELVRTFRDSADARDVLVRLLERDGQLVEALAALRGSPTFYKDYERRLIEARLLTRTGDVPDAMDTLQRVVEPADTRYIPILLYHGVVDHERTVQITTKRFEEHLAALAAAGYQTITVSELLRMIEHETPLPSRVVIITFDDGRTDSFANADAALARYGYNATIFVLSGRAGDEDAFQAGWPSIAGYASTGRWDIQAHGHDAHDPIVINRQGNTGEFLSYLAWRPADRRSETFAEYSARVEGDYVRSKSEIERHLEPHKVIAFAYPMNVIGLAQQGGQHTVPPVNEQLASRHYRFGFVQDTSGYNGVRSNAATPFLLRRFEVPGAWSGDELVAHLDQHEPRRAARLQLAQLVADDARPEAARRVVAPLGLLPPPRDHDIRTTLAYIAFLQDRPHEAAGYLADVPPPPDALRFGDSLENRVGWRADPRVGARTSFFTDSNDLGVLTYEAVARFSIASPIDLELSGGGMLLTQAGHPDLTGQQATLGAFVTAGHAWDGAAWGRYRQLSQDIVSVNGGGALRYRHEQHSVEASWSYDDVETIPAALREIRKHAIGMAYQFQSREWRAGASFSHAMYEDENRRESLNLTALRLFGPEQRWGLGGALRFDDTSFNAREYYSPRELIQVLARASFAYSWRDSRALLVDLSAGAGHDTVSEWRLTGRLRFEIGRWWGDSRKFRTALTTEAQLLPDYRSFTGGLRVDWRF